MATQPALMSLSAEEFRRQMLGASRVEILAEAGYDAVIDLRESRTVHRKLLSSENDLVRFKAVELDHKIHGTLAPLAVHDATPRFSVSIKLDATLPNAPYRNDKQIDAQNQGLVEPVNPYVLPIVDTAVTNHHGLRSDDAFSLPTPPTPPAEPKSRVARGAPKQRVRARPASQPTERAVVPGARKGRSPSTARPRVRREVQG